jgi:spoIIIJ-associated protein
MSEERATLEKIAPTVEEAVADALAELGLSEDDVDIEILDEGSKGLLGIGGRQARVRLTIKGEDGEMPKPAGKPSPSPSMSGEDMDVENLLSIAEATVDELLDKMGVTANVAARTDEEMHPDGTPNVVVDITGDDLSILIGRKAETLNALQYITRLIVGKEMGRAAHLSIDVEGYRARRERSLEQLAHRMATQAVKTGRRQTLEPMPPNERRLIHIALRDNDEVTTESVGEEPRRKVMIIPNE